MIKGPPLSIAKGVTPQNYVTSLSEEGEEFPFLRISTTKVGDQLEKIAT